jgi:hypothetical protein
VTARSTNSRSAIPAITLNRRFTDLAGVKNDRKNAARLIRMLTYV